MNESNLLHVEGMKGYYTCPCGKNYTAKVRTCDCGITFINFHQSYIHKEKIKK